MPHSLSRRTLLGAAAAPFLAGAPSGGNDKRPNILVVLTDDQRFDAYSAYGKPGILSFLKTPNIDRLCAGGVQFRNAFATTSLCSPSRASIMSGKYVHTHGVWKLNSDLKPDCRIFPSMLKEAGYETGMIGKWHLGIESDLPNPAFDFWAGFKGLGVYNNPTLNVNGTRGQVTGYLTDILTDHAIEFVSRKRDRPFFLHLAHKAPHEPVIPPTDLESLYSEVDVATPVSYYEDNDDKPAWFENYHGHDAFHVRLHPKAVYQEYVRNYCRTLVSVDRNLGRLFKALDDHGLSDNTVIFLLSDNGHLLGEHQLYSKMIMYEESIRIPIIVRFPGQAPAGTTRNEFVLNVDMAPTILDIAGVPIPKDMEGRSFRQLILGKSIPDWRKSFLYEYDDGYGLPPLEGVRTADGWQYCRYTDWEQLYYMPEDPFQIRNLAANPRYAQDKTRLMEELRHVGGGRPLLKGPSEYKRLSGPVHIPHPPDF